jgi:cellulose synthase/poly-beta-1,6-N-acetylglucosamine synthase-like glycosyltransferase
VLDCTRRVRYQDNSAKLLKTIPRHVESRGLEIGTSYAEDYGIKVAHLKVSFGIVLIVIPFMYYVLCGLITKALSVNPASTLDRAFTPFVSVVIPTFNEMKMIEKRVRNFDQLEYPASHLEVIFVDGASTDGTPQVIDRLSTDRPFIRLLRQPSRQGYNSAVYEGICRADSDIIVAADAGSLFHPRAIASIVRHLADPSIGAATGKAVFYNPDESLATRLEAVYRGANDQLRVAESKIDSTVDMKGELLAFRKEIGLKLRPRETLPDNASFDTSVSYMARSLGLRAIFDPEAIFYEYAPISIRERIMVQIRRGTAFTGTLWRFRSMILNPKFGYFGLVILPSRFLMLVVFPWMFLAAPFVLLLESLLEPVVGAITLGLVGIVGILFFDTKFRHMFLSFGLSQIVLAIVTLLLLLTRHTQVINTAPTTRR